MTNCLSLSILVLLPILALHIGNTFNLWAKAAPITDNLLDLFQNVDKESNLTANTRKVDFTLVINPVDDQNKTLPFHFNLKSSLWLTNDEFTSLKNYLGDQDLVNALKIIRRKFFRRFHSQNMTLEVLKYKLLSALVFSSMQGPMALLKNKLGSDPALLSLMVLGYQTKHKNADEWKPLVSDAKDFEFHVLSGSAETPETAPSIVSSVFDKKFYENLIFNSLKPLAQDVKQESDAPIANAQETNVQKPVEPTKETEAVASTDEQNTAEQPKENILDINPSQPGPSVPDTQDKDLIDFDGKVLSSPKDNKLPNKTPQEQVANEPSTQPLSSEGEKLQNQPRKRTFEYDKGTESAPELPQPVTKPLRSDNMESLSVTPESGANKELTPELSERKAKSVGGKATEKTKNKEGQTSLELQDSKGVTPAAAASSPPNETPVPTPSANETPVDNSVVESGNSVPAEEVKPEGVPNDQEQNTSDNNGEVTAPENSKPEQSTTDTNPLDQPVPPQTVQPSQPENVQQPSGSEQAPQDTPEQSKDNNVVDSENPVPTEELKSSEGAEEKQDEGKAESDASTEYSDEPAGNTISNVRKGKGDRSKLTTTFSLGTNDDASGEQPTFYSSKKGPEPETESESSDTESQTSGTDSESGKSQEELLEELQKRFPPYNETALMDRFRKVDTEDVNKDFKSPLTIKLKVNFLSSDKLISVPVVTTARLLLPKTIFTMCIREELTQQCAFELKDRLMARFEDNNAEAFKWGRLVSLLQALSLQSDVFVEKYIMKEGDESTIEISRPAFMLPMKTLNFLKQLVGNAESSDKDAYISFELIDGVLNIPVGSVPSDLGQNYGVHAQLKRFLDIYTDFEVTHSLFDLPTNVRVHKKSKGRSTKRMKSEDKRVITMDELLSMNVDTKDLNNDIHFILSGYEKALFSIPKRLSGYKLMWETVDKYPELQRLWIEALTLMKLMDKSDNLRNFLSNHTFSYQELKDLFEITYGIIAADNYDAVRDFYESVGITQKDVDTNLARVKSLFFAKTGSNVTRLPPILKQLHTNCLIKNMITSLSSYDLIERMMVMFVPWIDGFNNSKEETNYELAFLCAGSSVLLQHWHYFQLDQNYYDHPVPFISLITSFSRLAQGKYKNPERQKEIKALVNSRTAKECRRYINAAGILATSPYKTATINMTPKSLLGAIGNALDVSMDSPPLEIAYAMKDYFKAELQKGKFGNSLGICLGLQLLFRLNSCFSVEKSNDYSLYMHGLLAMDTSHILESYTNLEANTKNINKYHNFLKFACNPTNPTVHSVMSKLLPLVSTESHLTLMDELVRREMLSPDITPDGYLAENSDVGDKDVVDLEDDTTTLLETFDDTQPRSLLEIADEVSFSDDNEPEDAEPSFIQQNYTHSGYGFDAEVVGMPNLDAMDSLYKKLFSEIAGPLSLTKSLNFKSLNRLFDSGFVAEKNFRGLSDDDLVMVTFDVRMEPLDNSDNLIALDVPLSFHKKEVDLMDSLGSRELLRLLLYRLRKRVDSLSFGLRHEQLKNHAMNIAKANNLEVVSIPVHESVAQGNVDLNTYNGLLRVLESMPEDGYYFELEGLVVPEENVGRTAAKRISQHINRIKSQSSERSRKTHRLDSHVEPAMVLQIIDPVDDTDINELTMPHEQVKKHDRWFYQKMTEL